MKKLLRFVLIISVFATISISAREIDNKGGTIKDRSVFTTGDVLKNTNIGDKSYYSFYSPFGYLYYMTRSISEHPKTKLGEKVPDDSDYIYNEFYILNDNPYAFTGKNNEKTDFVMPTYYGDNVLWLYGETGIPREGFDSQLGIMAMESADFNPISTVPTIKIVCDKDSTNVGETTHCDLLFNEGFYRGINNELLFTNVDFNLTSDDYEISNVVIDKKSAVTYSNNHVSGKVLDINKYNDFLNNLDTENADEYKKNKLEYFMPKYTCLQERPEELGSSVGGYTYPGKFDYRYKKIDVTIKLLSFDITSTGNSEAGLIKLSDVQIAVDGSDFQLDSIVIYENEKEETAIPIVGLVKGVEENPETGLFNYLLLIIPVGIFIEGLVLLNKKKNFIKL